MPCGVTKTLPNGQVVTCSNPGTSAHSGQHSGSTTFFNLTIPVYWTNTATEVTAAGYKRALPNVRRRDDQQWLTVPTVAALAATGMNKSGTWSIPTSWGRPPGWVARSGFTGVDIETDALVMNGTGNVRVSYRAGHTSSGFGYTISKRLLKNGVVLHESSTVDTVHTVDTAVVAGDLIWPEVVGSFPFGGSGTLREGATETYVYTAVL